MKRSLVRLFAFPFLAAIGEGQCDLQTIYAANAGSLSGGLIFFDIAVTNPIRIGAFSVNTTRAGQLPMDLEVYLTDEGVSFVGNELVPCAWTLVSSVVGGGRGQGLNQPSRVDLTQPIELSPGTYGVALRGNFSHRFGRSTTSQRVYSNGDYSLTLGSATARLFDGLLPDCLWNGTVHCQSSTGTIPDFVGTPRCAPSPLQVSFVDRSFTDVPGGVVAWSWDFDGDGVVDSTQQNPTWTYSACGIYGVALTVTDASGTARTLEKPGYVVADPTLLLEVGFEEAWSLAAPLRLDFTDTSVGSPSAWAWDFDGDGTIDSTQQNPGFVYPATGFYDVTLTASNACRSRQITRTVYVLGNDECAGAVPLPLGRSGPFANLRADRHYPWSNCVHGFRDAFFTHTATCDGVLQVDVCGASFDTILAAFEGDCANPRELTCLDDDCFRGTYLSFPVTGGETYTILVGGVNGGYGTFPIELRMIPGTGGITEVSSGCGATSLEISGPPVLGGTLTYQLADLFGVPYLSFGFVPLGVPLCPNGSCLIGTRLQTTFQTDRLEVTIPCDPTLIGGSLYTQGVDLGGPGGCRLFGGVDVVLSPTYRTTIG